MGNRPSAFRPLVLPGADETMFISRYRWTIWDSSGEDEEVTVFPIVDLGVTFGHPYNVELLFWYEHHGEILPYKAGMSDGLRGRELNQYPLVNPLFVHDLCEFLVSNSTETTKYWLYANEEGEVKIVREEILSEEPTAEVVQTCVCGGPHHLIGHYSFSLSGFTRHRATCDKCGSVIDTSIIGTHKK